jgi:hypothetical protein
MYSIEDRSIVFTNGLRHTFNDFIAEALPFDDVIVVRLENQGWKRTNENIFAINYKGLLVWQIKERMHAFADSHYVNIYRKNDMVEAYNWDGTIVSLNPKTGFAMGESFVYSSSTRETRKREFI